MRSNASHNIFCHSYFPGAELLRLRERLSIESVHIDVDTATMLLERTRQEDRESEISFVHYPTFDTLSETSLTLSSHPHGESDDSSVDSVIDLTDSPDDSSLTQGQSVHEHILPARHSNVHLVMALERLRRSGQDLPQELRRGSACDVVGHEFVHRHCSLVSEIAAIILSKVEHFEAGARKYVNDSRVRIRQHYRKGEVLVHHLNRDRIYIFVSNTETMANVLNIHGRALIFNIRMMSRVPMDRVEVDV